MFLTDTKLLLQNGRGVNGHVRRPSYKEHILSLFSAREGQPGWIKSFKFLFDSRSNAVLVLVPLSFFSHHLDWDAALRSTFSFIALIPLVKVA